MGLLSKIFKPFKKIIQSVGKQMKFVAKLLWKPIKAVLKPIAKVFGKLGPLGTIALAILLPGIGGAIGSWFQAAGGAFQGLFAPGSFMHNMIGSIGKAITSAGKFGSDLYGRTIGRVFGTISDTIAGGIDALTGAEWGTTAGKFETWVGKFTNKLSYKGDFSIQAPNWGADVTQAATEATNSITTTYDRLSTDPTELDALRDMVPKPDPITVPLPVDDRKFPKLSDAWKKTTGFVKGVKTEIYDPYATAMNIKEAFDPSDPTKPRYPGDPYSFTAPYSANIMGLPVMSFGTEPFGNAPTFYDLLASFGGAINTTITPRTPNPFSFLKNASMYGFGVEDAVSSDGDQ